MYFIEILKATLLGIIEGITEWLPISSTGHLILFQEMLRLKCSDAFFEMFQFVIQLGAILAVVVLYFKRLNPFALSKSAEEKRRTWQLWFRIIVAIIPSAIIGLLFEDWFDKHFYNHVTVAIALIFYGVIYILLEKYYQKKQKAPTLDENGLISYRHAMIIGAFQVLSIIPGTSRSGSTILGGMAVGASRPAAAEFSFFLAIPTMVGASLVKVLGFIKDGVAISSMEWIYLLVGCGVAFAVSLLAISALVGFVRRHTFIPFGVYRIALGVVVLAAACFA